MHLPRLIPTALLTALAAAPAQGEIVDWRYISGDLQATTSTCIGSNESPICVADTLVACRILLANTPSEDDEAALDRGPCRSASRFAWGGLLGPVWRIRAGGSLYFYLLETYPLADEVHYDRQPDSLPTDVIVDIYPGTCSATVLPETDGDGRRDPALHVCRGFPFDAPGRYNACGGSDPDGYLYPSISLILRETLDGFHLVGAHYPGWEGTMAICHEHGPARWRDSFERLLSPDRS